MQHERKYFDSTCQTNHCDEIGWSNLSIICEDNQEHYMMKITKVVKTLFFFLCSLILMLIISSCGPKKTKLSEKQIDQFATVYANYLTTISSDTAKVDHFPEYLEQILKQTEMTKESFMQFKNLLENDPVAFNKMLESVNKTLEPRIIHATKKTQPLAHQPVSFKQDSSKIIRPPANLRQYSQHNAP